MLQNPHSRLPYRNFRISYCLRGRVQESKCLRYCVTHRQKWTLQTSTRNYSDVHCIWLINSKLFFLLCPSNKCHVLCAIYPATVSVTCSDSLFSVRFSIVNTSTSSISFTTSTRSSSVNNIPVSCCNPSFINVIRYCNIFYN